MDRISLSSVSPLSRALLILAILMIPAVATTSRSRGTSPSTSGAGTDAVEPCGMTDQQMKAMSAAWYATHPRTGAAALGPASVIVKVGNFYFNADNNTSTRVDTVHITAGETVAWQWEAGSHTVTSGIGSSDPEAGQLFDQPINSSQVGFAHTFPEPGMYPFFCAFHELSMKGYIDVQSVAGVTPIGGSANPGFVSSPSPNPTAAGTSFRFQLERSGRVQVQVFDVGGRRIAVVVDEQLNAGAYQVAWDGRSAEGAPVQAGVYFVRLIAPGLDQSRRLVKVR